MNRRELLAGVIGAAGCAALPAATSPVASPIPVWRFSEVTRGRHSSYHDRDGSYMLEVDGKWIEVGRNVFLGWVIAGAGLRPIDGFFTDIAHSGEVEYVA